MSQVEGKISEGRLVSAVGCESDRNDLGEYGVRWLLLTSWTSLQEYNFKFKILSSLFDLCSENQRTSIQAWQDVIISYTHRPEEAEN